MAPLVNGYLRFVAYDEEDLTGSPLSELTDATEKSVLIEVDGAGAGEFNLNRISDQRQDCRPGRYIRVWRTDTIDETITGDPFFGFWVSESQNVVVSNDEYGGENYHRLGEGTIAVLADAIAWWESVDGGDAAVVDTEDDSWHWTEAMGAYAGGVMVRLLEEAQARGCFDFVSWDFDRTTDSNGDPWTSETAISDFRIPVGTDLLSVAGQLQPLGLTFVMDTDFVLHAYETATYGTDRSGSVSFERTVNLTEQVTHDQIAAPARSTVLVKGTRGDNGETAWVEADSVAGLAEVKRRKEGYIDAGSATGYTTLVKIGTDSIYQKLRLRRGPAALPVVDSGLVPFVDYFPGDTVNVNVPGTWNDEALRLTAIQLTDRETGDYDVLTVFDAGPSYQSKAALPPPQVLITPCCPDEPFVPEFEGGLCASATATGTYGPNLSATSAGTGNVFYIKPGFADPGLVPNPGYVGSWSFAAFNSGGVDYAGDCTGSTARLLVIGAGTMTIHTATYAGSSRTLTATLYHVVGSIPTADSSASASTGTDIVINVTNHAGAYCAHYVDVVDNGGTCGGKWGFAGFDWVSTDAALVTNAPTDGQQVNEATAGDGSTDTFQTNYPYYPGSLQVFVDGVLWGVDETDPTTGDFTFDSPPPNGAVIIIVYQAAGTTDTGAGNDPTPDPYTPTGGFSGDAVDVDITDAGGYYTATDVEAALQEIANGRYVTTTGGGKETYKSHSTMGSTETIDLADGNYHYGTLNADCTFTFSGSTTGKLCSFILELIEDGTGGWDPTWPGSVVWIGDTPTHDTTAGTTTFYVFHTRDNGTTWYGAQVGGSSVAALDDLTDVNAPSPSDGQVLTWDSTPGEWVAATPTVVADLDDLTDVVITSPASADRLRYNGSAWVNSAAVWVPVMVEDGATGLWYVAVTGDGDAVMTEVS